jgi:hypothetical protein
LVWSITELMMEPGDISTGKLSDAVTAQNRVDLAVHGAPIFLNRPLLATVRDIFAQESAAEV